MWFVSPLLPILCLLFGASVLLASRFARGLVLPFFPALTALTATTLALLLLLGFGLSLPLSAKLSTWGNPDLLAVDLSIELNARSWTFAVGMTLLALATLLTGLVRPGGQRLGPRVAVLLLTALGVLAVAADNLITLIILWVCLDVVYFLTLVWLARGAGLEPQAVLHLSFNSIGTLLAVTAAILISRTSTTLSVRDAALTAQSAWAMTGAAVFRLGLFPLHLGLPTETNIRQGLGTVLRLIPAAVALELMSRLIAFGLADALLPWLMAFGLGALWVGALQLWNAADPRQGLVYVVIAQSGLALLAGLMGGVLAIAAQALMVLLGGGLMFLSAGHDEQRPWATALPVAGALGLIGAPLTIGFVGSGGLYSGLINASNGLVLLGVMLGQGILFAGCLRAVFWPAQPLEGGRMERLGYQLGLGGLAVASALGAAFSNAFANALGAIPTGPLGVTGWASVVPFGLVLVSGGLGLVLWRFADVVQRPAETAWQMVTRFTRLWWLYRVVWGGLRLVSGAVGVLADVLEGEGALLWALVAALGLWLLLGAG